MADLKESFNSGVAFQYISVSSMFVSSTVFYFFLAHLLPTSVVGSISLLYAIMAIGTTVFMLGLGKGIQHFFSYHLARNNNNTLLALIRNTALLGTFLSISAFFSIYFLSYYISILFFHSAYYELYIKIIGIAIASSIIVNIFAAMLLGLNQYKKYSLIYSFVYTLTYLFPLILLFIFGRAIYLVSGVAIITSVSALVFVFFILKLYKIIGMEKGNYESETYKNIIHYSVPLFFSSIMGTSATYIDRIVVSYFVNLSSLGIYNFALVIASAATLLVSPVSNLLIPKLSSFFALDNMPAFRSSIRMLLNMVSLLYIPSALGIAALSRPLLFIFAGQAYEEAYIPLIIIMFTTSVFIGSTVLITGISSIRKTRIYVFSSSLSLISNLVLSVILIPIFGIVGAAVSYSSMNAVNFFIVYYYAKKFQIVNYDKKRIIKIWIASLIMFTLVFLFQSFILYSMINIFIFILLGIIIYLFEIKAFKLINRDEMNYVLSVIPERFSLVRYIIRNLAYYDRRQQDDMKFRIIK